MDEEIGRDERGGRGGMGRVWRAYHEPLDRFVALKIPRDLTGSLAKRFQREARVQAKLDHPSILDIYDAGVEDGTPYIAMRLVLGDDLGTLLKKRGRMTPQGAIAILRPVASAIDFAHREGVLHRDVKPGNVLVAETYGAQQVFLADFGIAAVTNVELTSLTPTGVQVGTAGYQPRELWELGQATTRSDIYALGCVAFEIMAGEHPFGRIPARIVAGERPRISDLVEDLDTLDAAMAKVLALDPEDRYPTCSEFIDAVEAATAVLPEPEQGERSAITRRPVAGFESEGIETVQDPPDQGFTPTQEIQTIPDRRTIELLREIEDDEELRQQISPEAAKMLIDLVGLVMDESSYGEVRFSLVDRGRDPSSDEILGNVALLNGYGATIDSYGFGPTIELLRWDVRGSWEEVEVLRGWGYTCKSGSGVKPDPTNRNIHANSWLWGPGENPENSDPFKSLVRPLLRVWGDRGELLRSNIYLWSSQRTKVDSQRSRDRISVNSDMKLVGSPFDKALGLIRNVFSINNREIAVLEVVHGSFNPGSTVKLSMPLDQERPVDLTQPRDDRTWLTTECMLGDFALIEHDRDAAWAGELVGMEIGGFHSDIYPPRIAILHA